MIPVAIVTGFLGSGKTTLIGRILRDPAFARTAVIVNEFGEIGLDHELIASSDETLLALTTGCLCCAVRSDLVATLLDLQRRREPGEIAYDRVLIETSGLADPAPILHALMTDPRHRAASRHRRHRHGRRCAARRGDARSPSGSAPPGGAGRHAAAEQDRRRRPTDALRERLAALNPGAALHVAARCRARYAVHRHAASRRASPPCPSRRRAIRSPRAAHRRHRQRSRLQRDRPIPALALTLLLEALAEHCGARLLRLKGLVNIEEMPDQPAVIHGVQHVFSPPEFLDRWPSADHTTRLVFIAQGVPRHFPSRLLDAIEREVREEMEQAASLRLDSRHTREEPQGMHRRSLLLRGGGRRSGAPRHRRQRRKLCASCRRSR